MPADVAVKAVSGENIKHGWALVYSDKQGNKQTLAPPLIDITHTNASGIAEPLKDRFDDPQYYG